jgi:hypothetical protein
LRFGETSTTSSSSNNGELVADLALVFVADDGAVELKNDGSKVIFPLADEGEDDDDDEVEVRNRPRLPKEL